MELPAGIKKLVFIDRGIDEMTRTVTREVYKNGLARGRGRRATWLAVRRRGGVVESVITCKTAAAAYLAVGVQL